MNKFLHVLLIALLVASPITIPAQNQTPSQPTSTQTGDDEVRISTNLVQTDVAVFDKAGKFVDGLGQNDFELRVDGQVQPVSFFERIGDSSSSGGDDASANGNRGSEPNTAANPAAPPTTAAGRIVTFFVDDLHLTPVSVERTRQVLSNFINRQISAGTKGYIVAASGQAGFLAQPTDDKQALLAAVRRINYQTRSSIGDDRPVMTAYQAMLIDRGDPDALAYQLQQSQYLGTGATDIVIRSRARLIRRQAAILSRSVMQNLEAVVRSLPVSQARNVIFYLSEGFVIDNSEADIIYRMRRVIDQAARRNAVIYTLDSRGLSVGNLDASMNVVSDIADIYGASLPSYNSSREISITQEPLRTLAADTGGRALLNRNNLEDLIGNVISETSRYYLLGWRPSVINEKTGEPKFRNIEVKVKNRPELKVRARRGYFNRTPEADTTNTARSATSNTAASSGVSATPNALLNAALNELTERNDVPIKVFASFINNAQAGSQVNAAVAIRTDAINFNRAPSSSLQGSSAQDLSAQNSATNSLPATLNIACVLLDSKGKPVFSDGREVSWNAGNNNASAAAATGLLNTNFSTAIKEPGIYQFRVAARDNQSGRIGTAFQFLEVPEFKPNNLALSSILLAAAPRRSNSSSINAETTEAPPINVERRFARASRMIVQLYVYNASVNAAATNDAAAAAPAPNVEIEIKVLRGTDSVLNAPPHKLALAGSTDLTRIRYNAAVPLQSLTPGTYKLQIIARDQIARKSVTRDVDFIVQ